MEEDIIKVETLTPEQAGKMIGKSAEYIRAGLRADRFKFGSAVPPKKPGGSWSYNVIKSKFLEYANIKDKKQVDLLNLIYLQLVEINKKILNK